MVHGDEKGLVLPPKIAPIQVIIIPIFKKGTDTNVVADAANNIAQRLKEIGIRVEIDADTAKSPGSKFFHWELRGVPVRIEIGPRDIEMIMVADRIGLGKQAINLDNAEPYVAELLETIQSELFKRARATRDAQWYKEAKLSTFANKLEQDGGFFQTGWCRAKECEQVLKNHKATTRCLLEERTFNECFNCTKPSVTDVLIARSY